MKADELDKELALRKDIIFKVILLMHLHHRFIGLKSVN